MSTATLTLDSGFLKSLPMPGRLLQANRREIPTLTSQFDLLADIVEMNWAELPVPIHNLAKAYAYYHAERDDKPSFFERLQFAWFMFRNMTAKDEIGQLLTAMMRLSDAVFTAIERENPKYQADLVEALDSGLSETEHPEMTDEEFREWMRRI